MKVDIVKLIIALAISALLAYACYEICKFEHVQWLITCGAFITIGIPASLALGISAKEERGSVMLKALVHSPTNKYRAPTSAPRVASASAVCIYVNVFH